MRAFNHAVTLTLFCVAVPSLAAPVVLPMGTEIVLETTELLSTKTHVKGDLITLRTMREVVIDGAMVIPSGIAATGQVIEARAKGAMGMNGKLSVRPLYLRLGDTTVRLTGSQAEKASVTAGAVIGMVVLTTPAFTGRSAQMPVGTRIPAFVERTVQLDR